MFAAIELERYFIIVITFFVGWVLFTANGEIANIGLGALESKGLLTLAARKSDVWNELGELLCASLSKDKSRAMMGMGVGLIGEGRSGCHAGRRGVESCRKVWLRSCKRKMKNKAGGEEEVNK
jgi:hypothetical protein